MRDQLRGFTCQSCTRPGVDKWAGWLAGWLLGDPAKGKLAAVLGERSRYVASTIRD